MSLRTLQARAVELRLADRSVSRAGRAVETAASRNVDRMESFMIQPASLKTKIAGEEDITTPANIYDLHVEIADDSRP